MITQYSIVAMSSFLSIVTSKEQQTSSLAFTANLDRRLGRNDRAKIMFLTRPQIVVDDPERISLANQNRDVCPGKGQFLNICGECVGGSSEKDEDYGMDSCGICHGLDRCLDSECFDEEDDILEETNCNSSSTLRLSPTVLDMAIAQRASMNLSGGDLSENDTECSLWGDSRRIDIKKVAIGLALSFDFNGSEEKLEIRCNTSRGHQTSVSLFVVNSERLLPFSLDKPSIPYGVESQITVEVSNLFALVDVLCFAKLQDRVIYKYWTNGIQGNSLHSKITCDKLWPESTGPFKIGVAYSEQAALLTSAKTLDVTVQAQPLIILEAKWGINDVITIQFNQNINEVDGCERILKGNSVNRFYQCETAANEIRLKCMKNACQENQVLELTASVESSNIRKSFALKIPTPQTLKKKKIAIDGPSQACAGNVMTFSVNLHETSFSDRAVQWSLSTATTVHNSNLTVEIVESTKEGTITAGNQQRRNLILWQGLRELRRVQKTSGSDEQHENVALNSSLLQLDTPYTLWAFFNSSNQGVGVSKNFIVLGNNTSPVVNILGPTQVAFDQMAFFEAEITSCGAMEDLTYKWKLGNNETLNMANGTKLFISGDQLVKGLNTVYVYVMSKGLDLVKKKVETKVKEAKLGGIFVEELLVGTGQNFSLEPLPENPPRIKYQWKCRRGPGKCVTPGKALTSFYVGDDYDIDSTLIRKGSLPAGRYTFTLTSTSPAGEATWCNTRVDVVPGEPPQIRLVSYSLEPELTVVLTVKDIVTNCEIRAKSLKRTNFAFYDIRKTTPTVNVTGTPELPESTRITVKVPASHVKYDTNYTFQVMANCGNGVQSWILFSVPVPQKSSSCQLKVVPKYGIALKTKFKFSLQNCSLSDRFISYGYYFDESDVFLTTTVRQQAELYGFPGEVTPIAKVCEYGKLCYVTKGDHLAVEVQNVEHSDLKEVIHLFKNHLNSFLYENSEGLVKLMAHSLGNDANGSFNELLQILGQRIEEMTLTLVKNSSVTNLALDLLQSTTGITRITGATNDFLSRIVKFRDEIHKKMREKSANFKTDRETLKSTVSPHNSGKDPRPRRSPGSIREETRLTSSTIKTMLTTFAIVILNGNDASKVREEKDKFLRRIPGYLMDLCNVVGHDDGVAAGSSIVQLSAVRIEPNKLRQEIDVPICSNKCSNSTGQLTFGRQALKNKEVCVGTSYMPHDYYSDTFNYSAGPHLIRQSGLFHAKIFNYNGIDVADEVVLKRPSTVFRLPLWKGVNSGSGTMKCVAWTGEKRWSSDVCKIGNHVLSNGIHFIECHCPIPVTLGIFSSIEREYLSDNSTFSKDKARFTTNSSSSETNREHPRVKATFMINEDFNDTVGDKQSEFDENLKNQLIDKVNLPEQAKVETKNHEDNVEVILKLKYWDQSNLPTIVLDLADLLDKGELKLLGLDERELKIPRQKLGLTLVNMRKPSSLVATFTSIVFLGLTIIVVMIFASVLVKWRRRQRALNFLQVAAVSDPKYLKLHDSASIERIIRQSSGEQFRSSEAGDGIVLSVYQQRINSTD